MDDARIIEGDCLEVLPTLAGGSIDLVVTDPPYNVGLDYSSTDDRRDDYREWCSAWLGELERVCRGPIAISVGQSNLSLWATIKPPTWWLAWWKPAAMGRCVVGFNNWEPIALYGKPRKAACDVIRAGISPEAGLDWHPCPKPIDWAARQIEMLSDPGAVVLDCFSGAGATAIASERLGRRFIGIEKDPEYRRRSLERIEADRLPMFADVHLHPRPTLFAFEEGGAA